MKYLAPSLKHRVVVKKAVQGIGSNSFRREYEDITTLWASIEILNPTGVNFGTEPIRYQNIGTEDTHKITVRSSGVLSIGKSFTSAFDTGYDVIADVNSFKADYFLFHKTQSEYIGKLYKINRVMRDERYKEFFILRCIEIEETGTGARNS